MCFCLCKVNSFHYYVSDAMKVNRNDSYMKQWEDEETTADDHQENNNSLTSR